MGNQKDFVFLFTYRRVFCTHYNVVFFKPKEDQYLLCGKETESTAKTEDFLSHMKKRAKSS